MGRKRKKSNRAPMAVPTAPTTKLALHPTAEQIRQPSIATHGQHATADGFPVGAVIHYTADGDGIGPTVESLSRDGFGYHFIIGRDGSIHQLRPLTDRLYHAGHVTAQMSHDLHWGADNANPARAFCGIALDNWGFLRERGGRFYAWPNDWKKEIPADRVRRGGSTLSPGRVMPWEAATDEQIKALVDLCYWLINEVGIQPTYFCGHDELRRDKMDPGGCLPFSMAQLRELLTKGLAYESEDSGASGES